MKTFYVYPSKSDTTYVLLAREDEAQTVRFDWSAKAASEGTSVSSVTWTVDSGNASVSGAAESADIATALVTTSDTADSVILVKATMADGQIDIVRLDVLVS